MCSVSGVRAWVELDFTALKENVKYLQHKLPNHCKLMPAVKANAYGHGAVLITRELNRLGIMDFCVATVSEGIELRKAGIRGQILVLGYTHPEEIPALEAYKLTQSVVDVSYGEVLNACGNRLNVHVLIDSGMHRLGERAEHVDKIASLFEMSHLNITGIYSHLCVSDGNSEREVEYTKEQKNHFQKLIETLQQRGIDVPKTHLLASYGVLNYPEYGGDYARVGIAMYGILSTKHDYEGSKLPLQPVLSIKSRIASIRRLHVGESAGYGMAYVAQQERVIATITIGYADGIPRELSDEKGSVLIGGREAPIVGRVCMDQTLIDITEIEGVRQGDEVVVIGKSGEKEITVYDLAEQTGTITNEILSRLGGRLERRATF